jgi:hypothetical protein
MRVFIQVKGSAPGYLVLQELSEIGKRGIGSSGATGHLANASLTFLGISGVNVMIAIFGKNWRFYRSQWL